VLCWSTFSRHRYRHCRFCLLTHRILVTHRLLLHGKTTEWKSKALRAYQRRTLAADALIASTYLAGTNTRRVRRALAALFGGAVGKDTVSRVWVIALA
jgi:Transposase, Mutator family